MTSPIAAILRHTRLPGLVLLAFVLGAGIAAAESRATFHNPVIAGFAPDPSITRKGEDFYLVNSSFEYFPALPIYHSRDLVNWTLISYALSDPAVANLDGVDSSGGIHAATIREHQGRFYVVTSNVVDNNPISFVVTADNPRGPWSAPVIVRDAVGIDPSLFFDDDGRVWYTANVVPEVPAFEGQALIWLQEMDPDTLQLIGERQLLWSGCCQGVWAEGPHLYKRSGTYYLLLSEGGTSFEHAISMASATTVTGPYVGTPRNPLLTHRHLSFDHPITGVGHADLVELPDGRWYGVALGWRLLKGMHGILGRETYLYPVIWETEREVWKNPKKTFPVMSPATGKIELTYALPFEGTEPPGPWSFTDEFDATALKLDWNMRRSQAPFHSLTAQPGKLQLALRPTHIGQKTGYSFLGIRQRDFDFSASASMAFAPAAPTEEAGLVLIQNDRGALLLTRQTGEAGNRVVLTRWNKNQRAELAAVAVSPGELELKVEGRGLGGQFYVRRAGATWTAVGAAVDLTFLSPAVLEGFNYTGLYVGLYASSNGRPSENQAAFDTFAYRPLPDEG